MGVQGGQCGEYPDASVLGAPAPACADRRRSSSYIDSSRSNFSSMSST
jgi:hypothetical protein